PYQQVLPRGTHPKLDVVDRPGYVIADLIDELNAAAYAPFDLATEPQIRVVLYRIAPDEHVLLVVLHHIASDGWSLGPLLRDLAAAYQARRHQRLPDFAELPVQYADYTL